MGTQPVNSLRGVAPSELYTCARPYRRGRSGVGVPLVGTRWVGGKSAGGCSGVGAPLVGARWVGGKPGFFLHPPMTPYLGVIDLNRPDMIRYSELQICVPLVIRCC